MSYPEFKSGESVCAHCGETLTSEYLTVRENTLIRDFFDFEDGQDNIFCDEHCLSNALFAEKVYAEGGEAE